MASHLVWAQFLLQTILHIVFSYVQENLEEKLLVNGYFSGYKKDTSIWSPPAMQRKVHFLLLYHPYMLSTLGNCAFLSLFLPGKPV